MIRYMMYGEDTQNLPESADRIAISTVPVDINLGGDYDTEDEEDDLSDIEEEEQRLKRSCLPMRPCTKVLYLWILLFISGCIVALVLLGVFVVAPYKQAQKFTRTMCFTLLTVNVNTDKECSCGKGCKSGYPCISVRVNFTDMNSSGAFRSHNNNHTDNVQTSSMLHESEASLAREVSLMPKRQTQNDKCNLLFDRKKEGAPLG